MINADMRLYNYFTLGPKNAYGQVAIPDKDATPAGKILMTINISSQSVQDNINFQGCNYIGLTRANVDDTYIIEYGNERLKVLYVNPKGRLKQVYLARM